MRSFLVYIAHIWLELQIEIVKTTNENFKRDNHYEWITIFLMKKKWVCVCA